MRVFPVVSVLFLSLSAFSFSAKAVTVSELPATIQSCIASGTCAVDYSGSYDSGTASAFQMVDLPSGQWNWLVRYDLVAPSGQTATGGGQNTAYNGYLWMQVASNYSATETAHPVTLFLDKVTPVPASLNYSQGGDLSLFMTTADLLAGGAYSTLSYISYYDDPNFWVAGNLSGDTPGICVAVGCQASAQLNLVQLKYQSLGSSGIVMAGFDTSDTRGLVYSQSSSYDSDFSYSSTTQSFNVSAVPEAQTSLLFGFGLLAVAAVVRRRK